MADHNQYCPSDRGKCKNCGEYWEDHSGWACPRYWTSGGKVLKEYAWDELSAGDRYLTDDMIGTEWSKIKTGGAASASDQWRLLRNNNPGECVCGIPRERCDYHK